MIWRIEKGEKIEWNEMRRMIFSNIMIIYLNNKKMPIEYQNTDVHVLYVCTNP